MRFGILMGMAGKTSTLEMIILLDGSLPPLRQQYMARVER